MDDQRGSARVSRPTNTFIFVNCHQSRDTTTMISNALTQVPDLPRMRLSVPRRGHVLSTISETYGGPIRAAVNTVSAALDQNPTTPCNLFSHSMAANAQPTALHRTDAEIEAWHLCTQWVVGVALGSIRPTDTLESAQEWFTSGRREA